MKLVKTEAEAYHRSYTPVECDAMGMDKERPKTAVELRSALRSDKSKHVRKSKGNALKGISKNIRS